MKNTETIKVGEVFAKWNPNTKLYESSVFAEDGVIKGITGEIYHSPMTAKNTRRSLEYEVKKGENIPDLRWKEITSMPKTEIKKWRISKVYPHSTELISKYSKEVLETIPNEIEVVEV